MIINAYKTPIFRVGHSLSDFLFRHLPRLHEGSIVVVTSKIVALAEGRVAVCATERARIRFIKNESQWAMKTKFTWLTIKDGTVMASAGIDQSNADGACVLLPKDCYRSAAILRTQLMQQFKVRRLGVLITDSRTAPLREGIVGMTLGYAGFHGLREYRGTPDIFGRPLRMTKTNVADSLAAAAVLLMGEGAERQPLAVITRAPVVFARRVRRKELQIALQEDMYRPLFENMKSIRGKNLTT